MNATSPPPTASPPPKHVGILALEVYTPRTFLRQAALEEHAGVAPGKYTIGLGQEGLAVTGDAEDVNSLCLTAVQALLEKYVCTACSCRTTPSSGVHRTCLLFRHRDATRQGVLATLLRTHT
jgi:hypothetical protein